MSAALSFWRIFVEQASTSLFARMFNTKMRLRIIAKILALVASFALLSKPAAAQTVSDTFSCNFSSTIDLGAVLAGGTLQDSMFILDKDTNNATDTVGFIKFPIGNISLSDTSSPLYLFASQKKYITTIIFSSASVGTINDSIVLQSTKGCQSTYHILAEAVGPDTDNSIVPLDHSSHDIIAFKKSDSTTKTLHIQFENNFDSSITIDTLTLQKDSAFHIDSSSVTFPATIPAGHSFTLTLSFIASTSGFYTDFIGRPGRPILPFSVQGLLLPNQAVQTPQGATIHVSIYPNPSHGLVTIHTDGLSQEQVTLTDVLGRVVGKAAFSGEWQWNGQWNAGPAASGTYFVLVTGRDASGKPAHVVLRIVIE